MVCTKLLRMPLRALNFHSTEITHAAVTTLVSKIEGNPFSDWTSLMSQVVCAAMECQGMSRL